MVEPGQRTGKEHGRAGDEQAAFSNVKPLRSGFNGIRVLHRAEPSYGLSNGERRQLLS